MARPRNDELKRQILSAANTSFHEFGYDKTSYSAIANACGISRNLVQYHYPKKSLLAIAFMEDVLKQTQSALGYQDEELVDNYPAILTLGTSYFEFLLSDDGYRQFLRDIVRDRDLSEDVLAFNFQWICGATTTSQGSLALHDEGYRAVISSMGGFYELLYFCLKHDQPFDAGASLLPVVRHVIVALGGNPESVAQQLPSNCLDRQLIASAVAVVANRYAS